MSEKKLYEKLEVKDLPNAEVEITASVPEENLEQFKTKVLEALAKEADVPGFRPGKVPVEVVKERISEQELLQKAAEEALQVVYPQIIAEKELRVIGSPQISITKLASGNPFEFKATSALAPEVTLPDYKKIASTIFAVEEAVEVTQDEIDAVLKDIRKTRTQVERAKKAEAEGKELPQIDPNEEVDEKDLLPLTDDFVQTLGQFENVDQFTKQIADNLKKEKGTRNKEKKRVELSEKLVAETKATMPQLLISSELQKMDAQFKEDVVRMGVEHEDYLKKINKTEEELHKEWEEPAEKRAKLQVILNKIASEEGIYPEKDEVMQQVEHIMQHYKEADSQNVRVYVETVLTNDKVYEFLESQGGTEKKTEKKEAKKDTGEEKNED